MTGIIRNPPCPPRIHGSCYGFVLSHSKRDRTCRLSSSLLLAGTLLLCPHFLTAEEKVLLNAETFPLWEDQQFAAPTRYTLIKDHGYTVVRADSRRSASGKILKTPVDLTATPYVHWRWRVTKIYPGIDEQTRDGDDFPARLYLIARHPWKFWKTRAINYVWASNQPVNTVWRNPYTPNSRLIAVASGSEHLNRWQYYRRNAREDFLRIFGEQINTIDAVAIMTDTDNTGAEATTYYGEIIFSSEPLLMDKNRADFEQGIEYDGGTAD